MKNLELDIIFQTLRCSLVKAIFLYFHISLKRLTVPLYQYKRKTWKGKMIKNMLKRGRESDTYLAIDSRQITG